MVFSICFQCVFCHKQLNVRLFAPFLPLFRRPSASALWRSAVVETPPTDLNAVDPTDLNPQ
jgi:hypothetical protein